MASTGSSRRIPVRVSPTRQIQNEFPPELFGPGGPFPLIIACNLFKTPSLWGVKHTAPYFHDDSSKTLEEVAEQYTFMFNLFAGITLTPQDDADIVNARVVVMPTPSRRVPTPSLESVR